MRINEHNRHTSAHACCNKATCSVNMEILLFLNNNTNPEIGGHATWSECIYRKVVGERGGEGERERESEREIQI